MWGVFILIIIIYIYYIQFYRITCDHKIFVDDLIPDDLISNDKILKTGDIIIFKAFNNFNSIFTGSYFGHIGIVYMDGTTPMLFEANGIEHTPLKPHHSKTGIFLTPLLQRIQKYKGRCFWKPLKYTIDETIVKDFKLFIDYALDNMYYEYNVISDGIKKGLGIERCTEKTNCGQLVFLSMIKLQLLDMDAYNKKIINYVSWTANIRQLLHNEYLDLVEVIDHPFHQ